MAQKTLTTWVILGGRVDNSFGKIGTELIALGSQIDEISQKLVDFGKESLEVYKNYEYSMAEMESVWGSNGTFAKDSRELKSAMVDMKRAVADWAGNSIFHTNDVANAMVEAAHAGWDYNQMLEGIPAAMGMAQAGAMDLSQAMEYIVSGQKSFGWEFDDLAHRMDEWIYAANRSAGTTQEFGDTFMRLGSTVRFASNTEELLAMTKVMHDMGTTGSAAGTLIRTSLMKLYAPSGKAGKILDQLGATAEEIKSVRQDSGLLGALNTLESHGFSVFDEATQQAKPALQVYSELGDALVAISGYTQQADESQQQFFERVLKHQTVMGVMSEVFGIRGIQGSMNMLLSIQEAQKMYDDLTGNAAEGTTAYVREMLNDTLYGSTELMLSKVEELHRKTGEELAGDWRAIQGIIGDVVDKLNGMDSREFSAMVTALETLVGTGVGITVTGMALRLLGSILTPTGAVATGVTVLAGLVGYLYDLQETDFSNTFGTMNLQLDELGRHVTNLGKNYDDTYKHVNNFASALNTATTNYQNATAEFSTKLLNSILTGATFTPEEKESLEQLGINIYSEVLAGIQAGDDMASEFWTVLYGGNEIAAKDPRYQQIIDLLEKGRDDSVKQAGAIFEKIKAAMLEGYENGFTSEDYDTILGYFREYNELVAKAQYQAATEEQLVQQEIMLHKAQTASLSDIETLSAQAQAQRDKDLSEYAERYEGMRARLKAEAMLYNGMSSEEAEAWVISQGVDTEYERYRQQYASNYDNMLLNLWSIALSQSDFGNGYKRAMVAMQGVENGAIDTATADTVIGKYINGSMVRALDMAVESFGGLDELEKRIGYYREIGDEEMASRFAMLDPRYFLQLTGRSVESGSYAEQSPIATDDAEQIIKATADVEQRAKATADLLLETFFDMLGDNFENAANYPFSYEEEAALQNMLKEYAEQYDLTRVMNDLENSSEEYGFFRQAYGDQGKAAYPALWSLLYGPASQNPEAYKKSLEEVQQAAENNGFDEAFWAPYLAMTREELMAGYANLVPDKATARKFVGGTAKEAEPYFLALAAKYLDTDAAIKYVGDVATDFFGFLQEFPQDKIYDVMTNELLQFSLMKESIPEEYDPVGVPMEISNATEAAQAGLQEAQDYAKQNPLYVEFKESAPGVFTLGGGEEVPAMAHGGRETRPALFAEAGLPEWFIPEEHTANTARLILGAAYGSGFSIYDLAALAGARLFAEGGTTGSLPWGSLPSLGGDAGGGIQVTYSPVIHAADAHGVGRALREDKARMMRMLEELLHERDQYHQVVAY